MTWLIVPHCLAHYTPPVGYNETFCNFSVIIFVICLKCFCNIYCKCIVCRKVYVKRLCMVFPIIYGVLEKLPIVEKKIRLMVPHFRLVYCASCGRHRRFQMSVSFARAYSEWSNHTWWIAYVSNKVNSTLYPSTANGNVASERVETRTSIDWQIINFNLEVMFYRLPSGFLLLLVL